MHEWIAVCSLESIGLYFKAAAFTLVYITITWIGY